MIMPVKIVFSIILFLIFNAEIINSKISGTGTNMPLIKAAKIQAYDLVEIWLSESAAHIKLSDISIDHGIKIKNITKEGNRIQLHCTPFDVQRNYTVHISGFAPRELQPDGILDSFYSEKALGCNLENNQTVFRLFAPRASQVRMVLFNQPQDASGQEFAMTRDPDGVWELYLEGSFAGKYYGYRVAGPVSATELFDPDIIIADPYSHAVASQNNFHHSSRTLILPSEPYDWQGDKWLTPNWRDLIILEAHIRDLTIDASSEVPPELRGSYPGLVWPNQKGGIAYIRSLGVNAVELLPAQEFANFEIPYKDSVNSLYNNWNPYERNHWGYMTSYFFAPETYYASGANDEPDRWLGVDGRQVREFKEMVRELHRAGIAVIMDVVYNHTSQYDWNPFKLIDKKYYYHLDDNQNFLSLSGCGNDFNTSRPMARRLILESVIHWMQEYHIDGFRFDLGALIDRQTLEEIIQQTRKINPQVFLTAEPWGGGRYNPEAFSRLGWSVWNDQFRNGMKGQNPHNGLSFIFGRYWANNNPEMIKRYIRGNLAVHGGPFVHPSHAINYLESHDDHTLGDFIRLGLAMVSEESKINDLDAHARLSEPELKIHKLAALILMTSQGAVMLSQGQDWGRSKVIAPTQAPDAQVGHIDHNSYNKDDATNYLNFNHRSLNAELTEYYQGLIALRSQHSAFRRTTYEDIVFLHGGQDFAQGFVLPRESSDDSNDFVVLLNAHPSQTAEFELPDKSWQLIVDGQKANNFTPIPVIHGKIKVPPISGLVLIGQ